MRKGDWTKLGLFELVDRFRAERLRAGVAATTAKTQTAWCRAFCKWVGPEAALGDLTEQRVKVFVMHLKEDAGNRPRTIRNAIISLRALARWAVQSKILPSSPIERVPLPRKDAARLKTATNEEVFALFEACDRISHDSRRCALARAAVAILIFGGLRRNELLSLKVTDVDLKEQCVHVNQGKGGKARTVYLPPRAMTAIDLWLVLRERCRHDFLLDFDHSRRIGDAGLRTLIRDVRAAAGLKDASWLLPHTLRHNYATRLIENGANLEQVRDALGHSSIEVTSIYIHSSPEKQREVAILADPPSAKPSMPEPAPERPRSAAEWRRRTRQGTRP